MVTLIFEVFVELWEFQTYFETSAQEICAILKDFFLFWSGNNSKTALKTRVTIVMSYM